MNRVAEELKKSEYFTLATLENGEVRLRYFSSVTSFEGNAYICTTNEKSVFRQMRENPKIAILALQPDGSWIRLNATAVWDDRDAARQAMLDDPTGPSGHHVGDGLFEVFRLEDIRGFKYSREEEPESLL